jgi:hypothetical protein
MREKEILRRFAELLEGGSRWAGPGTSLCGHVNGFQPTVCGLRGRRAEEASSAPDVDRQFEIPIPIMVCQCGPDASRQVTCHRYERGGLSALRFLFVAACQTESRKLELLRELGITPAEANQITVTQGKDGLFR